MRSVVFLLCLLASSSYAASPFFNAKVTGASSGGSSGPINTSNIVVDVSTASNTQVLYASGTTIDGALGLVYDRIQNRVTVGTPTAATPVFGDTLRVSGTQTVTGVLTVGSCVGCGGAGSGTPISTTTFTAASNISMSTAVGFNTQAGKALNLTAYGAGLGNSTMTGNNNILIGSDVGIGLTSGDSNIAMGVSTFKNATTASTNVGIGANALVTLVGGSQNTAIGPSACASVSSGSSNVCLGQSAGNAIDTGTDNIAIGHSAQVFAAGGSSQLSIGNAIYGNVGGPALQKRIGINITSPTTAFGVFGLAINAGSGPVCITSPSGAFSYATSTCGVSSKIFKKNISTMTDGLDKVMALRPVYFEYKDLTFGVGQQVGLIAEEVSSVVPQVVSHYEAQGDKPAYSNVDYAHLVAPLISAIQTLEQQNKDLVVRVNALEAK